MLLLHRRRLEGTCVLGCADGGALEQSETRRCSEQQKHMKVHLQQLAAD